MRNMSIGNRFVIGGGIAGLLYAYAHPDYTVLAGKDFSQREQNIKRSIPLPQYIYSCDISKKVVERILGKEVKTKQINVGIWYENEFVEPNELIRAEYYAKTREIKLSHSCPPEIPDHVMSSNTFSFEVLDVTFIELMVKIYGNLKDRIIETDVYSINEARQSIKCMNAMNESLYLDFVHVVSTIPQPELFKLVIDIDNGISYGWKWKSVYLTWAATSEKLVWDNDFDYILFPNEDLPWYRLTKGSSYVGIESITKPNEFPSKFCSYKYITNKPKPGDGIIPMVIYADEFRYRRLYQTKMNYGKIVQSWNPTHLCIPRYFRRIGFFGRWGTWNPRTKVHDLMIELFGGK